MNEQAQDPLQLRQAVLEAIEPDGFVGAAGVTALALLTYRGGSAAAAVEIDALPTSERAKAILKDKVTHAIFIARRDAICETELARRAGR